MATISPRYDDQSVRIGWQAKIRKKGFPAQTKTFRNKSEAQAWAKATEADMERGTWRDKSEAESTTLSEALDRYADEVAPRSKDGGYRQLSYIRRWKRQCVSRLALARVRGKDIADAIKHLESEGKSANTIRLHLAVLSHLYTVAGSEWGMESLGNPVQMARGRKPRLPQGRERRLVGDEEQRLLDACKIAQNPWLLPIVQLAIETAMRAGEIMGLEWQNVDLNKRVAFLPDTKNGTARTVPLSSVAVDVLQTLPRSLDGRVFGGTYSGVHSAFETACKRAGIEGLRFHDLRHEATSRLFERGFNPMEVSSITGHKTLQMLKRYTHLRAEDLAKRLG